MRIPLLGGSYEGISTNTSSQEAINFYFEAPAPGESHEGAYLPVHGASLFDTLSGVIRGLLYDPGDELLYVVGGSDVSSVTEGAVATSRATIGTTTGRVEMALNPLSRELVIVDGSVFRHYDIPTTTSSSPASADDAATTAAYINGRFLVNDPDVAGRFAWSDVNDGTTWDSLSIATAQSLTTEIKKILVDRNDIYLFGAYESEVFYNSGDPDQVFERYELIESGIAAPSTAAQFDNTVAWLRRDQRGELQVVRASGSFQPQIISTPELSRKWHGLAAVEDAFAYAYAIDGHEFYVLCFPDGDATYAYDAATQRWHQRSGAFSDGEPTREIVNAIAFCGEWGGHIVGDYRSNGRLYALQHSTYTWAGDAMDRQITGPGLADVNEARLRFSEVQVDIAEGSIQSGDTGDERTINLAWSNDGGHNYNAGVDLDIGESDERDKRLMVRKLGMGRHWIFRLTTKTIRKIVVKGLWGRLYAERKGNT